MSVPLFNPFCTPRQIPCRFGIQPRLNAVNELPGEGEEVKAGILVFSISVAFIRSECSA